MNWKNLTLASLFAALSFGAVGANAAEQIQSQTYMYGEHLDIAKVVSMTEDSAECGIINARLTYLDSAGQTKALDYRKFAQGCTQDN